MFATLQDYAEKYLIFLICLFAFFLRFKGLNFGLPYIYKNAELRFVEIALRVVTKGDFDPRWYGYPGSFFMYLMAAVYTVVLGIYYVWCQFLGNAPGFTEFTRSLSSNPAFYFGRNPVFFILISRFLTLLLSVVTIYLIYMLAEKLFSKTVALLAAFCLSIAPLHIAFSRFVRIDNVATMLIVLSFYLLVRFFEERENSKILILSSFFAGVAIATKYTSGLCIFPLLFFCFTLDSQQSGVFSTRKMLDLLKIKTNLSKALLFILIGFVVFSPFTVIKYRTAIKEIQHEARGSHLGYEKLSGLKNHLWYLKGALNKGIGGLFFEIFAGLGLLFVLREKSFKKNLFLSFPLLHFVIIGGARLRWDRWFIPILPFEAILFGVGLYYSFQYLVRLKEMTEYKPVFIALFTAMTIIAAYPVVANDIKEGIKLTRSDSRTLAKEWIEENLPAGSRIAYEHYAPHLHIKPKRKFALIYYNFNWIAQRPLNHYKRQKVDYIIITDSPKERFYKEPQRYAKEIATYEALKKEAALVKKFGFKENPGPVIEIYRI